LVNKLYAFCLRYQEKTSSCQILRAQGSLETRDGEGLIITNTVDQRICEKCADKKFVVERPECLKCGGWLIRECAIEAGSQLEFCYKCYHCDLYFYSIKKLERFAKAQEPQNPAIKPAAQADKEKH
jgi:hypothetical protein